MICFIVRYEFILQDFVNVDSVHVRIYQTNTKNMILEYHGHTQTLKWEFKVDKILPQPATLTLQLYCNYYYYITACIGTSVKYMPNVFHHGTSVQFCIFRYFIHNCLFLL